MPSIECVTYSSVNVLSFGCSPGCCSPVDPMTSSELTNFTEIVETDELIKE